MLTEWEYQVVNVDDMSPEDQREVLNHYGRIGWELVAVRVQLGNILFYFKKPKK